MNKVFDRYTSVIFLALGIFIAIQSQSISGNSYGSRVGSSVFPLGLGILLVLLSIRNFYETFRGKSKQKSEEPLQYKKFLAILAAAIAYALLMEPLGYVISTFLFLLFTFQVMERKGLWKSVIIAAAVSAGVYFLYVDLMDGTLPGLPDWLGL